MQERFAAIRTADGTMETFMTHPQEDGPLPAVIIYMDVWGVREELYDIAHRLRGELYGGFAEHDASARYRRIQRDFHASLATPVRKSAIYPACQYDCSTL